MNVLITMVPTTLFFGALLIGFLMWGVRNGQYEDIEGEKYRILFEDELH